MKLIIQIILSISFSGESYFFTRKADAETYLDYEFHELGGNPRLIIHNVKAFRAEITKLINIGLNAAGGHPCSYELHDNTNFEPVRRK